MSIPTELIRAGPMSTSGWYCARCGEYRVSWIVHECKADDLLKEQLSAAIERAIKAFEKFAHTLDRVNTE